RVAGDDVGNHGERPEDLHPAAAGGVGGGVDVTGRAVDVDAPGAHEPVGAELAHEGPGGVVLDDGRVVDGEDMVGDEVDADSPGALVVDHAQVGPVRGQLVERHLPLDRPDRAVDIDRDVARAEAHGDGREEGPRRVEFLDHVVAEVGDVDVPAGVD